MKYMGSKNRIAKHILPIMLKDRKEGQYWVEPFVGGANMIDKVTGNRIGADSDEDCVNCLKLIRDSVDILPRCNDDFSEKDYKQKCESRPHLAAYAAYAFSFSGKKWGGFRRDKCGKRDYIAEAYRSSVKQSPNLSGVALIKSDYLRLEVPPQSIIYCDPPYEGATGYKDKFSHADFWQWCREKSKEGHAVFVSEYSAPDDFECIWQQELNVSVAKDGKHKKATERLFTIK